MPLSREEIDEIRGILGREPRIEELAMFEAQWSEHCSYKSSRLLLKLLPTSGRHVLIGPGRDAPAVELFPGVAVVFKIESHNHPSAVDPYDGAATGVGGIVRDILTLGAKPIALLDLLYMGDPRDPHANWLIRGVVKGISDYGNRIGVPTVAGDTWFDHAFNKQPLVNVVCVGIAPTEKIAFSGPRAGDLIVIIGNATGRDGILGSSFASKPLTGEDEISAVQVGDPLTEKLLIDAILELSGKKLVKLIKDLGGGGLTTAISEVAAEYSLGAEIFLDRLHTRQALSPVELLVSESQERMLLVVEPDRLNDVIDALEKFEVSYSVIGSFDASGRIRVYYKGELVADVPARELARPRAIRRTSKPPLEALKGFTPVVEVPPPESIEKCIILLLSSPNIASKRWIYEQYDHEVGIRTVIKPGYGDAAVLRLLDGSRRGLAVKGDANPRYTYLDPFSGAANCVAECFRNLVSVGSKPLAIVDELNAGNPEKPDQFWYFEEMLKGVAWMSEELGLPVVGGKVSFYNEDAQGKQVKPTSTIVGVGRIDDVTLAKSFDIKSVGSPIAVVGVTYPELGGTEYLYRIHGLEIGEVPRPRPVLELNHAKFILKAIEDGLVLSVHDVSLGGLAIALLEMAVGGRVGIDIDISKIVCRGCYRVDEILFSETQARYVVEVDRTRLADFIKLAELFNVPVSIIGSSVDRGEVLIRSGENVLARLDLGLLRDVYENSLSKELEW
uniref:Phosphoribosylformylglycinamidine synthase subunit PurL n=1 Tax=Ignisphaera aggregans TaxID=334771 RepID=A0A7C2Z8C2_9CREN